MLFSALRRALGWAAPLAIVGVYGSAHALELPFQKSHLRNGMTLIVHEDHTLPLAAVNLLYRVGSRDEVEHRTGFAHLFEHLMFMGTTRAPTKMFDAWMESVGGSNNAWTNQDFTDYFEVGPPASMPLLLWLEADRLGALGHEIDAPKLDLQRDVVRNERRQSIENVPYGKVELRLPELMYPADHPYHHPVIGSHEDLESARVDDVKQFFAAHYEPANASIVIAGDVKPAEAVALAERDFGSLPAGTAPPRALVMPPPNLGKVVRETIEDRVELAKIVMAFHSPANFEPGDAQMDLFASILATGKASRLYKALVYDKPLAQSVEATQASQDLSSLFHVEVIARPGVSLDALEKATDAVLAEAIKKPPTDDEMKRAKNEYEMRFVQRLQSLGERATLLNLYEAKKGDPGFLNQDLNRYRVTTASDVQSWAQKTINLQNRAVIRVIPLSEKDDKTKAPPAAATGGAR